MKIEKINEQLYKLLIREDKEFVISITGEWGIGKTFFWKQFLKDYKNDLKDKKIAYISLFGNNSLSDIRTSIILQSSPTKKKINFFNEKLVTPFKNLKSSLKIEDDISMSLGLNSISSLLSLLTSSDFKNVIICFDDFERISSKLDLKDVLGLISELKEQKQCKILMIMNEKELHKLSKIEDKEYGKLYGLYKEKIIDIEMPFEPTPSYNFNNIKKSNSNLNNAVLENFFNSYNIVNIRIMKQIIQKIEYIYSIINIGIYDEQVQNEFLFITMRIFLLQNKYNLDQSKYLELKKAIDHNLLDFQPDEEDIIKITEDEKEILEYIDKYSDTSIEDIIFDFIKNTQINKIYLKSILDDKQNNLTIYSAKDNIINSWHKLHIDFKYSQKECANHIWNIFKDNSDQLHNIISIDNFHYYSKFLSENIEDLNSDFIDKIIKQYIDKIIEQEKSISIHEGFKQDFIKENYPDLVQYWDSEKEKKLIQEIDITKIEELLEKVTTGWGEKDQYILNNIRVEDYKNNIINSSSFVNAIIDFLSSKRNDKSYFVDAIKNIKKALQELSNENEDYKFKVDKILKETKVQFDT